MTDNKIRIKRSVANSIVTDLSNGELAFTQASNTLHICLPDGSGVLRIGGAQYPGILTNNHALVANSTGGINKIVTSNAVITSIIAEGSPGNANQVLRSNGSVIYWSDDSGDISSISAANGLFGGGSSGDISIGVVVGSNGGLISNTTGVWINAGNGLFVDSNGLNIGSGNGIAISSDSLRVQQSNGIAVDSGGVRVDVSTNGGLVSNSSGLHIRTNVGLATNSSGLYIVTSGDNTLIANSSGLFVNDSTLSIATSQLSGEVALGIQTSGVYVANITSGNGVVVNGSGSESATVTVGVLANTGIVSNSTGVYVNSTYISTLSANNTSFLGGTSAASYQLNSTLNANIASYLPTYVGIVNAASHTVGTAFTANSTMTNTVSLVVSTNTVTIGTGSYFVSNGNVGIGTTNPAYKLHVAGDAFVSNTLQVGTDSSIVVDTTFDTGISGYSNTGYGVIGSSNTADSIGVWGISVSGSAVYGESPYGVSGKFVGTGSNSTPLVVSNTTSNVLVVNYDGLIGVTGSIIPSATGTYNLGSSTSRWANVYTGDLVLSNDGTEGNEVDGSTGSWVIQEGKDNLYIINRTNGKKYKFNLTEIQD